MSAPKPIACPFCGSTTIYDGDGGNPTWVYCGDCGAEGPSARSYKAGLAKWNERADVALRDEGR